MNIEFSHEDLKLIDFIFSKEESETCIEIHHCRNCDYKEYLKGHLEHIRNLLAQIRNTMQAIPQS